ncbi:MAG: SDR family NAD(P)-dependent oxidoreductase [Planctomycetota bacterium]
MRITRHWETESEDRLIRQDPLVTGGSRGIGCAISLRLAECGARVAINYARNTPAAEETRRLIRRRRAARRLCCAPTWAAATR